MFCVWLLYFLFSPGIEKARRQMGRWGECWELGYPITSLAVLLAPKKHPDLTTSLWHLTAPHRSP